MALGVGAWGWAADLDAARFLHTPKDSHLIDQPLRISAQLTEAAGVSSVQLFYKSPDRATYTVKTMQASWQADLAPGELSPLGLSYFFEAKYADGRAYRSRDYSTVLLVVPPAIREMLYRDDASGTDVKVVKDELILKLDPAMAPEVVPNAINQLILRHNAKVLGVDNGSRLVRMQIPSTLDLKAVLADLSAQSAVAYAHPHGLYEPVLTPNDPMLEEQWAVQKMRLPEAWNTTTGDVNVIVGIIDTGRDPNHPDLSGQFLPGYDYYANDPDPWDVGGHGTMVAGVVGAIGNNGTGVAGTNWKCKILPYRVGDWSLSIWAIVQSLRDATDKGARVINMSFGGFGGWPAMHDALKYAYSKGVVLIAAAGNSYTQTPVYPAAYPEVIGVVATNRSDQKAYFSSYGSWVDVSAPGQEILTTTVGGGYKSVNGTSFASPYTAGLASLLLSVNPTLTNEEVREILRSTAVDLGSAGFDNVFGYGRIDAPAAVMAARGAAADDTPPVITHFPVREVDPGISVSVLAAVTDNVAVHSGILSYRRKGDATFTESIMSYLGGTLYEGVIPKSTVEPPAVEYSLRARDAKGNWSFTPVYTIAMKDRTPPVVQHTPPSQADSGLPMTIAATVTDDVGVKSATAHVRMRGESGYTAYEMTAGPNQQYQATIPGPAVRMPAIQYYFSATDTAGNQPPTGQPGSAAAPHEVKVVYVDRTPPFVAHDPVAAAQPAHLPVRVEARITDDVGVAGATLFFRPRGKPLFDTAPMMPSGADSYIALIPASAVVSPAVEYYIDATDSAGNRPAAVLPDRRVCRTGFRFRPTRRLRRSGTRRSERRRTR